MTRLEQIFPVFLHLISALHFTFIQRKQEQEQFLNKLIKGKQLPRWMKVSMPVRQCIPVSPSGGIRPQSSLPETSPFIILNTRYMNFDDHASPAAA